MSNNKTPNNFCNNQEEIKVPKNSKAESESLYKLDIQLLSSLKPIPGKTILLDNKINQISNSNQDINRYDNINIINKNDSINNINYINNDKTNMNNYQNINNIINNNFTTNNYFINGGFNFTNMNFNNFYSYPKNNQNTGQNCNPNFDCQLLNSSNYPSFLSFNTDIKNNNYQWTENKFTQNSFIQNIIMYNNNENNNNCNLKGSNIKNNNYTNNYVKLSQLSFQYPNCGNGDLYYFKKSSSSIIKKKSDGSINNDNSSIKENNNKENTNANFDKKDNEEHKKGLNNKNNYNLININEEDNKEENKEDINIISQKKKSIYFNIEHLSESSFEEYDEKIYNNSDNNEGNKIFNCYYTKKKRRRKDNKINKYKCSHPKCEYSFQTKKQLKNHHFKSTKECQLDSVNIIKLISNTKKILRNIIKNNKAKKEKFEKIYDYFINKISLKSYFEYISGSHFNDITEE